MYIIKNTKEGTFLSAKNIWEQKENAKIFRTKKQLGDFIDKNTTGNTLFRPNWFRSTGWICVLIDDLLILEE